VGIRLSGQLGVPLVHTGHSLGRVKRRRLLARGLKRDVIEARYNMSRRIEAEEDILGAAELVITSTNQEIEQQYGFYDHYQPDKMRVMPPGTALDNFYPADGTERDSAIYRELGRFLLNPDGRSYWRCRARIPARTSAHCCRPTGSPGSCRRRPTW